MEELKRLFAELQQAVASMQTANNEAMAQTKAGIDASAKKAEVDAINATITKLNKDVEAIVAAQADASQLATRMEALELAATRPGGMSAPSPRETLALARDFFSVSRGLDPLAYQPSNDDLSALQAYRATFRRALACELDFRRLGATAAEVQAAMSVGSDPAGGYLVPPEISSEVVRRVFETSPMRQFARAITIGRSEIKLPKLTDDAVIGGWVGEKQARPATGTPEFGLQAIDVHDIYAYPQVTADFFEDAQLDVAGFLQDIITDRVVRSENTGFVTGDGVGKPRGFMSYSSGAVTTTDKAGRAWGKLQYVPMGHANGFPDRGATTGKNADALINTVHALKQVYRTGAMWAMTSLTEAYIRTLVDADGHYLWRMGLEPGKPSTLLGYGVTNFEDMPEMASNAFPIAFGNFNAGYLIVDRRGITVLQDPYTNKPYVGFYFTKRTGGDVRDFDAIKLMKQAAS